MRKIIPIGVGLAGAAAVAGGLYKFGPQLATMASLKKLSDYEDGFNLYEITVKYDYDVRDFVGEPAKSDQASVNSIVAKVFPGLPVSVSAPSFGCSAFKAQTEGAVLTGRSYDFRQDTSALLVRSHPAYGFASMGFACLNNLGANKPETSLKTKAAAALAPFFTLDGINERGVSISVLTLDSEPTRQNAGSPAINTSLAIRLVLDQAATTQQAVQLLRSYDMYASVGRDYHFFINDAAGNSVVVEYDPEDPARPLVATPVREMTNYFALYASQVEPYQKNGIYGHGKERALAIAKVLDNHEGAISQGVAWEALRACAQDPNPQDVTSNTQWSVVYDNTNLTAQIALRRRWDQTFEFSLQ